MARESIAVRALLVSRNDRTVEFLSEQMQKLAINVDTCCDTRSAAKRLCRAKFQGVIVDLGLGEGGLQLLETLRDLTSHRHAISYAIVETPDQAAAAFRSHANFVLQRPFLTSSVLRTLRAAYPMMFRERRRGYRHAIEVRTLIKPQSIDEFWATSVNISETGMAISSATALGVGERVHLRVELPDLSEPALVSGEVCWNTNGRAGMRFVDVSAKLAEHLQLWLSERMSELIPA